MALTWSRFGQKVEEVIRFMIFLEEIEVSEFSPSDFDALQEEAFFCRSETSSSVFSGAAQRRLKRGSSIEAS